MQDTIPQPDIPAADPETRHGTRYWLTGARLHLVARAQDLSRRRRRERAIIADWLNMAASPGADYTRGARLMRACRLPEGALEDMGRQLEAGVSGKGADL
jgi:hypothetical protein